MVKADERFPCPVCGAPGEMSSVEGSFDICKLCGWEDDGLRDYQDNINGMTLEQAKIRWLAGETLFSKYPNPKSAQQ